MPPCFAIERSDERGISERMGKENVSRLQEVLKKEGIDYYIIPTADYHQSEYVGEYFKARQYVTGFTGSAGTAVVSKEQAWLWTDGRYFIQAEMELAGSDIALMKMGEEGVPTLMEFVKEHMREGECLAVDGRTISFGEGIGYQKLAEEKAGTFVWQKDLVDEIWKERPKRKAEPVWELGISYAGETRESKLQRVRSEIEAAGAACHLVTALDDICWILNIRGNDIAYFPMTLAYLMIREKDAALYIEETKINETLKLHLEEANVTILPYDQIYDDLTKLEEESIFVDPKRANYALMQKIPKDVKIIRRRNPSVLMKCMKNETEINNIKKAQIKDGVAHVRLMKWLKERVGKEEITEIQAANQLVEYRRGMGDYIEDSFEPISAYGEHAAIVHYSATEESNAKIVEGGMLLMDTGAGYLQGSTDITRTYGFGNVPYKMREDFTMVCRANLALANSVFLEGCTGSMLDMYARAPFWREYVNFNHGTGHGVGYLMNIHEAPMTFAWRGKTRDILQEGMIITDEPGIYIEGSHGIRMENEVLIRKSIKNEYGQFMELETITYVPMDLDLILPEKMSTEERNWLNAYHKMVYETISPFLNEEECIWLKKYTKEV